MPRARKDFPSNAAQVERDKNAQVHAVVTGFGRAHKLSTREMDVLIAAVVRRLSNKETANALGIKYGTVKQYWRRICFKIDCRDSTSVLHELIAHACGLGVAPAMCKGHRCDPQSDANRPT
jgi:DNA-binding CsgD family transcriptional regulator